MDLHSKIKRNIRILIAVSAIFAGLFFSAIAYSFQQVSESVKEYEHTSNQLEEVKPQPEAPSEAIIPENTPKQPESAKKSQESVVLEEKVAPQAPEVQMERIPFTSKEVQPGQPESYVDTYGQCPFYENAGAKGCYPPADIQCNADWSVCEYIGTQWSGK